MKQPIMKLALSTVGKKKKTLKHNAKNLYHFVQNVCISQNKKESKTKSGTLSFYNSQPAWNKSHFFKIVNQFTQYRLLVNHNKYTFQYIIRNKYWKSKLNTGSLKLDAVLLYLSLLTLYALAQLICTVGHVDATDCLKAVGTLPLYCRGGVRGPSYFAVTHIRLRYRPLLQLNMGRYLQAWKRDKYLNSCRSKRAQGKEFQHRTTVMLFTQLLQSTIAVI